MGCGVWGFTDFEGVNYLIFREKKSPKVLSNKVFRFIQQALFRVCGKKFFLGKWGSGEVVSSPYHPKTLSPYLFPDDRRPTPDDLKLPSYFDNNRGFPWHLGLLRDEQSPGRRRRYAEIYRTPGRKTRLFPLLSPFFLLSAH